MPFRSKELLELWLGDFVPSRVPDEAPRVVFHDDPTGLDTGIVVVPLADVPTSVYCAPVAPGDPRWQVTMEAQDVDAVLTAARLRRLSAELDAAAELCSYLEERSLRHLAELHRVAGDVVAEVPAPHPGLVGPPDLADVTDVTVADGTGVAEPPPLTVSAEITGGGRPSHQGETPAVAG